MKPWHLAGLVLSLLLLSVGCGSGSTGSINADDGSAAVEMPDWQIGHVEISPGPDLVHDGSPEPLPQPDVKSSDVQQDLQLEDSQPDSADPNDDADLSGGPNDLSPAPDTVPDSDLPELVGGDQSDVADSTIAKPDIQSDLSADIADGQSVDAQDSGLGPDIVAETDHKDGNGVEDQADTSDASKVPDLVDSVDGNGAEDLVDNSDGNTEHDQRDTVDWNAVDDQTDALDGNSVKDQIDAVDGNSVEDQIDAIDGSGIEDQAEVATPDGYDDIYDQQIPRADSWWTENGVIYFGSTEVVFRGLNWFGLETADRALHGLWTGRTVDDFLKQIKQLGFNALRIPLSPETIRPGYASPSWANHGDVDTGREQLDELLDAADANGIYIMLDMHTCDPNVVNGSAGTPDSCVGYSQDDWLADLTTLAELSKSHSSVMGIDLFNEPYELTWKSWRNYVEKGARAVLTTNPRLLIFVGGVGGASNQGGWPVFWGENLVEAADFPPRIPRSRLIYSPHVYSASVYAFWYFYQPDFPDNMPQIWEAHFGYLAALNEPLVIGEFGGLLTVDSVTEWHQELVSYMLARKIKSFFLWALNPNAGDTGGILLDDWITPDTERLKLLEPLMP